MKVGQRCSWQREAEDHRQSERQAEARRPTGGQGYQLFCEDFMKHNKQQTESQQVVNMDTNHLFIYDTEIENTVHVHVLR